MSDCQTIRGFISSQKARRHIDFPTVLQEMNGWMDIGNIMQLQFLCIMHYVCIMHHVDMCMHISGQKKRRRRKGKGKGKGDRYRAVSKLYRNLIGCLD